MQTATKFKIFARKLISLAFSNEKARVNISARLTFVSNNAKAA